MRRLLIFLFFFNSCRQPGNPNREFETAVTDSILQMLDNYHHDIRKQGLLAEFKYLDSSEDFFWVPPGYASAISYDSVASILKLNSSKYTSIDNSWDSIHVRPLNKEFAIYTGRLRTILIDTTGIVIKASLVETGIVVKRKTGWKLMCGQTSMLSP